MVAAISEARLERLLRTLVGFGTRNTLSETSSPTRGIGAARQWIFDELTRTSPRLQVAFDTHKIGLVRVELMKIHCRAAPMPRVGDDVSDRVLRVPNPTSVRSRRSRRAWEMAPE